MSLFDGQPLTKDEVRENFKRRAQWERQDKKKHPPFSRHVAAKPDYGKPRKDTKAR
jgi:hypothetical protein